MENTCCSFEELDLMFKNISETFDIEKRIK